MKTSKMHTYILFFIIITFLINCCISKKYYNYTLFRSIPVKEIHLEYLNNLSRIYDVNFWRSPGMLFKPVDFVVSPEARPAFLSDADKLSMYLTTIIISDVQRAFDMQTVKTYVRRKMDSFDWNNYFRLDDIYKWLEDLAKAYPSEMKLQSIGKTYEDRDIMAVRIVLRGCKMRSKVIVEGGIHAREWIAPAFVTYMINQVLRAPTSKDAILREIAITYQWYFVPVLNPDGYEFSHSEDRLWRKNRHDGPAGVDLNRNFGHAFGTVGISRHSGSDTYCGQHEFSEKESRAMADFVKSHSNGLEYYLAFHSYGQYMIIPYANVKTHHENFFEVRQMCQRATVKIASKYNTQYTFGTAYDTVGYLTSGVSGCWVKKQLKVPYVITFELRDNGYDGFALPPHKILPTCIETMDGVMSLLTPRSPTYVSKKLREYHTPSSGNSFNILDTIVIVFNAFLFIIVRFD